ncbi:hypothetical protein HDU91_006638 [Kappamyces sp. JEL0680]|nr:hypothetical protein HDU91_006638 [Kappamyces sp. JEL0680]
MKLENLPTEILASILEYVGEDGFPTILQVSKTLYQVLHGNPQLYNDSVDINSWRIADHYLLMLKGHLRCIDLTLETVIPASTLRLLDEYGLARLESLTLRYKTPQDFSPSGVVKLLKDHYQNISHTAADFLKHIPGSVKSLEMLASFESCFTGPVMEIALSRVDAPSSFVFTSPSTVSDLIWLQVALKWGASLRHLKLRLLNERSIHNFLSHCRNLVALELYPDLDRWGRWDREAFFTHLSKLHQLEELSIGNDIHWPPMQFSLLVNFGLATPKMRKVSLHTWHHEFLALILLDSRVWPELQEFHVKTSVNIVLEDVFDQVSAVRPHLALRMTTNA